MKKIFCLFAFFISPQFSFANGNIACLYIFHEKNWLAVPGYGVTGLNNQEVLMSVSIGIQEAEGGHALCSRFIEDTSGQSQILEQAHYIGQETGAGPDSRTCDYESSKPFQTIFRGKVTISQGNYSKIEGSLTKVYHYVPTELEQKTWLTPDESLDKLVLQKCLDLLPGSIPADNKKIFETQSNFIHSL